MQTLSCSSWDLAPRSRVESRPPALGVGSCSHWTTRVVPMSANFETLKILPLYFHETFANSGPWRFQRHPPTRTESYRMWKKKSIWKVYLKKSPQLPLPKAFLTLPPMGRLSLPSPWTAPAPRASSEHPGSAHVTLHCTYFWTSFSSPACELRRGRGQACTYIHDRSAWHTRWGRGALVFIE